MVCKFINKHNFSNLINLFLGSTASNTEYFVVVSLFGLFLQLLCPLNALFGALEILVAVKR